MALPAILTPFLPFIFLAVGGLACAGLVKAFGALVTYLKSKPKLAPLAPVAELAEEALEDGVKAAEKDSGKPALTLVKDAGEAALADVEASKGVLLQAGENEIGALVAKPLSAVTPDGNSMANMPAPKGFAVLGLMACLAVGAAVAAPAITPAVTTPAAVAAATQVSLPASIAPYDFGLTLPGLKFPWGGNASAPVQIAGGAGFHGEANFIPVTVPVLGLVPLLSVGGVFLGDITATGATSYEVSIGPEICFLHSLCISLQSDLAAGGTNGLSGLLAGKFGYANEAGFLFFNTQALLDAVQQ